MAAPESSGAAASYEARARSARRTEALQWYWMAPRGPVATARFVLGAVLVDQLTVLHRSALGADLRVGLKSFLQAA